MKTSASGFTLIEIMIAVAIFTLIGLASTSVMNSVIESDQLSKQRFDQLQKLQRAMLVIERDFLQAVPRAVRIEGQTNNPVFRGQKNLLDSESDGVAFVRAGWQNPQLMLQRSTLQGVAYRLYEGRLERLYGNYVDNVIGTEPKIRVLLEDVSDLKITYLLDNQDDPQEQDSWDEEVALGKLPLSVSFTIESKEFGLIQRQFILSSGG